MSKSKKIRCDCCGKEILAEIKGEKLIIFDKRHGQRHMVILTLEEITRMMKDALIEDLVDLSPVEAKGR